MDVTFREFEPYYTKPWDLDPLEEFSSVTESDSREGENEGAAAQKKVIVGGAIPCPMDVSKVQEEVVDQDNQDNVVDMRSGSHENGEMIDGKSEEVIVEGGEEMIDGTYLCLAENRETIAKKPIVYKGGD